MTPRPRHPIRCPAAGAGRDQSDRPLRPGAAERGPFARRWRSPAAPARRLRGALAAGGPVGAGARRRPAAGARSAQPGADLAAAARRARGAALEPAFARLVAFSSTSRFTKANSPDPAEREIARRAGRPSEEAVAGCSARGRAWPGRCCGPTLIYAEGLRQATSVVWLAWPAGSACCRCPAGGEGLRQPVHADDLAAVAPGRRWSVQRRSGRAYDLPGGETLTYRTMAERVLEGLGRTAAGAVGRRRCSGAPVSPWRRPGCPGARCGDGRNGWTATWRSTEREAARDLGWAPRPFRPRFD